MGHVRLLQPRRLLGSERDRQCSHRVFQVLFWVSIPFWLVLTFGVITGHAGGQAPPAAGFTWAGFLAMFTVAASYNITYAPYV